MSRRNLLKIARSRRRESRCMVSPSARCKSLMDAVLLARARGSCYICFSATADRSGLTSRSDHKKKGENLT